jgi:hypothetical protein
MSNLTQAILVTIGVAVGSAAGTYTTATILIPEMGIVAPTAATLADGQQSPSRNDSAGNDLILSPADYLAAAEACRGVDPSIGVANATEQLATARATSNALLRKAVEAAGLDPKTCAKR